MRLRDACPHVGVIQVQKVARYMHAEILRAVKREIPVELRLDLIRAAHHH